MSACLPRIMLRVKTQTPIETIWRDARRSVDSLITLVFSKTIPTSTNVGMAVSSIKGSSTWKSHIAWENWDNMATETKTIPKKRKVRKTT